jgi:methionyl-tRNA formyltransferase
MRVEREMDAGAVALQRAIPIGPDENTGELEARLSALCAECVTESVDAIEAGAIAWIEQDATRATLAPKMEKADAALDFTRPAVELALRVRAMAPSPGALAGLGGEPLRILAARAESGPVDRAPGVIARRGPELRIASGEGWLLPTALQRAGGKRLATAEFLRGREIRDGERLETLAATTSTTADARNS